MDKSVTELVDYLSKSKLDLDGDGRTDDYVDEAKLVLELRRDESKWNTRMLFAKYSFLLNVIITLFFLFVPIFLTSSQVQNINDFNSIIITLIGFNSSIILAFIGAQSWVQKSNEDSYRPNKTFTDSLSSSNNKGNRLKLSE